jgi:outer membrane autotransporter protein
MSTKNLFLASLCFLALVASSASALTISEGETNYTTSSDISESTTSGLYSNFAGTSLTPRTIVNSHTISTTGSGTNGYGIRVAKSYNNVTNSLGAAIITTGSSGRGISVFDNSEVNNAGNITTSGSTAYGIHARTDSSVINSGNITTTNTSSAYGIYLSGNNGSANNSGTISTKVYGIYSDSNFININNSGTITTTTGSSAHGIFVSAGGSSAATSSDYSTITNSGTINANANGIYAKDAYTEITNSGTITSGSGSSAYGIRNEGANSTITNSAIINSTTYAIHNSGAGTIINNSGTINGGIIIGAGTLNILGGSISGVVDGSSNTGDVNINSDFTQSAAFTNLNLLNINSSNALISNASISANIISIDSGASLTIGSGSSITATIQGASASAGTLNVATDFTTTSTIANSSHSLANLNINSNSSLSTSSDIYADNILLNGSLNFNGADNLIIFGSVAGSGSGAINLGTNSQTIDKDFTLNSGDTLGTSLGAGTAGNLTVNGIATINANSKLAITPTSSQGYIVNGTTYTLISGSSGSAINAISNSDISVNGNNSNIYGLLKFTTQTSGDSLILTIDRLSAANATPNQNTQNIYTTINDIGAGSTGLLSEFQGYLDSNGFTGDELTKALRQVSPQSSKAALSVTNNAATNALRPIEGRLNKLRNHAANGFWVQGLGVSAEQKDIKDDFGFKANSKGMAFGADKELSENSTLGAALNYTRSDVKSLDKLQKNLISSNQVSIYNSQNFDKYFVDSVAGFSWNLFSSNRAITALDKNATARFSGQTYLAKIKAGRIFKLQNGFILTPDISLNILHNKIAGYSEKGADELNLKVGAISANFVESRAGINLGWIGKFKDIREFKLFSAALKFSYGHAFVNDAPTTKASFSGQSQSFDSKISHLDNSSLKAGVELAAYHKEFTTFSADYDFEKRATYSSHLLAVKIRQEF